jgi:hypothetical protein
MSWKLIFLLSLFSLSITAISQSITLPPDLARVLTDYETFWRKGDGAALAGLFDADGFVLPNGAPAIRGREAIQR